MKNCRYHAVCSNAVILTLLQLLCCGVVRGEPAIRAGFGKADITPKTPVVFMGFSQMQGVHDPIYVKALALDSGVVKTVILSADLCTIERAVMRQIRDAIHRQTGLPTRRIIITATHTHSVPYHSHHIIEMDEFKAVAPALRSWKRWWMEEVVNGFTMAAVQSLEDLAPVQVAAGNFEISQIASNRRIVMPSGEVRSRSVQPEFKSLPDGVIDPQVGVLRFSDARGKIRGVVVNYACHPVSAGWRHGLVSGDFTGLAMQRIERLLGDGSVAMYLTGCCGDINPGKYSDGEYSFAQAEKFADRLSDAVLEYLPVMVPRPMHSVDVQHRRVSLRIYETGITEAEARARLKANIDEVDDFYGYFQQRGRYSRYVWNVKPVEKFFLAKNGVITTYVHTVALGDVAIVFLPGEMLVEHGLRTKRTSPFSLTLVAECTDRIGYVPTRKDFAIGGYEPRSSTTAPGSGERLVAEAIEMLKKQHAAE